MTDEIAAARAELHESVRQVLSNEAWSTSRPLAPGTDGMFGRAQFHFDCLGDGEAVALLERMNITIFRLRQSLLSGDEGDYQAQRRELKRLSAAWLYHAPLHRIAELLPPEGEA